MSPYPDPRPVLPAVACPDGGACHHGCVSACWRTKHAGPLSDVFPNDRWPTRVTYDDGLGEVTETYVPEPCNQCGIPLRSLDEQAFTPEGHLVCGRCHRIDATLREARKVLEDLRSSLRRLFDALEESR